MAGDPEVRPILVREVVDRLEQIAPVAIRPLTLDDEPQMAALVALTEPGPWRPRTIELGDYFGVFDGDRLVAMAGERQRLPGFTEVSAVCTHPDARRRGLGAAVTAECLERGLSMNIVRSGSSANCFRMAPPLSITEDEIDLAVSILDESLAAVLARGELAAR